MKGWQRLAATLVLTVAGVQGLDFALRSAPLPRPACLFFRHYEALGKTKSFDAWQKFLLSWAFTEESD